MMKYVSFLRKPLWLSLAVLAGFASVMTGSSKAHISFANRPKIETDGFTQLPNQFPRPAELKDAVDFWRQVFGGWQAHQIVLHDDKYLGVIYNIIEITGYIGGRLSAEQQAKVDASKKYLAYQLNDLEYRLHKHIGLTKEQQKFYNTIISHAGRNALHDAAQRLRAQRGMKESFQMGLKASSQYTAPMRDVFRENRLPEELVHLPHVESAFTTSARSPAGAVGVWQFMPVTGKRFLRIDNALDERYDPILATYGAAKYLSYAYQRLGDWGLAVTSYNYGLPGMLRARQGHGKDIARIISKYDGDSFGFASRNYYAEFLAVCDIMADLSHYFPKDNDYQAPPSVKKIGIAQDMTSGEIAKKYNVHFKKLAELNPAWTKEAADGRIALPANIAVWIPSVTAHKEFGLVASSESQAVASKANISNYALSYLNNDIPALALLEKSPDSLSGRPKTEAPQLNTIKIALATPVVKPKRIANKAHEIHIVKSGESPYTIASKYSVHLRELLALNEIEAGTLIRPGQPIRIPLKLNG